MGNCKDGHCSIDKTKKGMDTSQKRGYIRASVSFVLLITGIVFSAVNLPFITSHKCYQQTRQNDTTTSVLLC